MKQFYDEVLFAKGIAVLLVVLGHSFPDASLQIFNNSYVYRFVESFIYSFHMPLFFFLSGFLFKKKENNIPYKEKIRVLKKKIFSLLIPYFFVSFCTLFVKFFLDGYAFSEFDYSKSVLNIMMGVSPNGGMWFLYTLFVIFSIHLFFCQFNNGYIFVFSLAVSVAFSCIEIDSIIVLYRIFFNFFFFELGVVMQFNYEKRGKFRNRNLIISLFIILFILNFFSAGYLKVVKAIVGIFAIWFMAQSLEESQKNTLAKKCLGILGEYSMDIYIVSYFIQIPIRIILYEKLSINYEICFVCMFVAGIICPVLLSKFFIRKNKFLSCVLLGGRKIRKV